MKTFEKKDVNTVVKIETEMVEKRTEFNLNALKLEKERLEERLKEINEILKYG